MIYELLTFSFRSLTTSCSSLNSSRHDTNRSLRHHPDDVIDDVNNESINSSTKAKSVSSLSSADKGSSHADSDYDGRIVNNTDLPPPPAELTTPNDEGEHAPTTDDEEGSDDGNRPPSYKDVIEGNMSTNDAETSGKTTVNDLYLYFLNTFPMLNVELTLWKSSKFYQFL